MEEGDTYYDKIPKVREKFAELFAGNINSGVYDERDIERIRLDDEHTRAYLRHQKGNVEKAATMIDVCLKWRKEIGINDLNDKCFPRELHDLGAVYWHNKDNKGQKILYFCVKKNRKDPEKLPLIKKFIAWHIEEQFRHHPDKKIVALLDMSETGFSNMDIDLIKFQISCFTTYFPGLLAYMLIFEMPWVLNAIWKVIKTLLSAEQQKAVIFVRRSDIQAYIDRNQLLTHMGGTDDYEYAYIPSEDSGIIICNGDSGEMAASTEDLELSVENYTLAARKRVTFSEKDSVVYTSFDSDEPDGRSASNNNNIDVTPNVVKRPSASDDNAFISTVLTICPADELEFSPTEDTRDCLDIISLTNNVERNVAYKIKTTSPEKYRVRPSTGVIPPNGNVDINVYLHAGQTAGIAKDKFLIMYMEVEPEVTVVQINDLFRITSRDNYSEHRLRCKLAAARPGMSSTSPSVTSAALSEDIKKLTQQVYNLQARLGILDDDMHTDTDANLSSENTDRNSENTDLNSEYTDLNSEYTDLNSEPFEHESCSLSMVDFSEASLVPLLSEGAVENADQSRISSQAVSERSGTSVVLPKIDTLLSGQQRLESQLGHVRLIISMLLIVFLLLGLGVFLSYWLDYLPIEKHVMNACVSSSHLL